MRQRSRARRKPWPARLRQVTPGPRERPARAAVPPPGAAVTEDRMRGSSPCRRRRSASRDCEGRATARSQSRSHFRRGAGRSPLEDVATEHRREPASAGSTAHAMLRDGIRKPRSPGARTRRGGRRPATTRPRRSARQRASIARVILERMRAMVLDRAAPAARSAELPVPEPGPGQLLLRVRACGGLPHRPAHRRRRAPASEAAARPRPPDRRRDADGRARALGVPWLGWTCGDCRYCRAGARTSAPARASPATTSTAATPSARSPTSATASRSPTATPTSRRRRCSAPG